MTTLVPNKIGEEAKIEAHGKTCYVKRISRSTWHMRMQGLLERSRFGTKQEIREDVQSFLETGALPRSCAARSW